jgi:tetratricopeptide (TPR) repeat protein
LQILVLDRASLLAIKQADCKEGEAYANKMSELGRETGRELVEATALQRLGRLRYLCCEFDQARDLLEESLIKFQNLKPADFDWRKIAWVQFDLGELEVDQGNFTVARDWLKKSLDSYQRSGLTDNNSEGTLRVNFAFVLHRLGDRQGARAQMTAAGKVLEHEGRQENYFRWYLHFCGRMAMSEGDLSRADKFFKDSLEIFYARKDGLGVVRSLLGFSCLAAMEGKYVKAARLLGAENSLRSGEVGLPQPPLDWKSEVELMESHARGALGQTAFDAARAKGMLMTLEEAVATTLSR